MSTMDKILVVSIAHAHDSVIEQLVVWMMRPRGLYSAQTKQELAITSLPLPHGRIVRALRASDGRS